MMKPIPLRTPVVATAPAPLRVLSEEETGILRGKVRAVLAALPPGRTKATLAMIHDGVCALTAFGPDRQHTRDALSWNEVKGFVEQTWNHDFDREEFNLTNRGRAKDAERPE